MQYKIVYQFRWLLVLWLVGLIYLSNLIFLQLPFIRVDFPVLSSFLPQFDFEFHIYNLQTVLVWTIGIIFGQELGAITLGIYILLGLLGLPVFASGGGLDYYKEPTFGYLMSLPLLAYSSGWLYERKKKLLAVIVPIFVTHLIGISYLLFFKQNYLDLSWHLSFSMIGYDLTFALLLSPTLPALSFFLRELFIQEVPVRNLYKS